MLHSLNNCDFDTNSISDLIRKRESSRGIKRKRIKQHRESKKEKQIEFEAVVCESGQLRFSKMRREVCSALGETHINALQNQTNWDLPVTKRHLS